MKFIKIRYMANIITGCRILCSVLLLFFPVFSPAFYFWYLLAGLSDMIDGTVARKTNTVSAFGEKLDTLADFCLIAACMLKILPAIALPIYLWIWICVIAVLKTVNVISGVITQKKFVAKHTIMNKATGAILFILPLTLSFADLRYSGSAVCAVATFAAIQEGHLIRTENQ